MSKYHNEAQQRLMRLILAMRGREFTGIAPLDLARAVNTSLPNVTRDLANLEMVGFAERMPGAETLWRLGPQLIQIAQAHQLGLARIQSLITETAQRYSRAPT